MNLVQALDHPSSPDRLRAMIGFSDRARSLDQAEVAENDWDYMYGSNLAEALHLAIGELQGDPGRIVIFSDLIPTAHTSDEGEVVFSNPASRITVDKTLEAIRQCESSGAKIEAVRFLPETTPVPSDVQTVVQAILATGGIVSEDPVVPGSW